MPLLSKPLYFYIVNTVEPYALVITFLLGGVILVGAFVIVVILRSRGLSLSRYYLAICLFGLIQHLFTYLLFTTQLIREFPHLLDIGYPLLFLVGPSFYFFVRSYAEEGFGIKKVHFLHLLPFFLILGFSIPSYFGPLEDKLALINYYYDVLPSGPVSLGQWFQTSLHSILIFLYSMAAWIYLRKKDRLNASLLKRITALIVFLAIAEIGLQTGLLWSGASAITTEIVLSGLMSVVVLMLGFWIVDMKQIAPVLQSKKYKTSPLSEFQSNYIKEEIRKYLEREEAYLKPDLKIADLSRAIDIPTHHISQVLGEQLNTNFYDIINSYRVEKAQHLLRSDRLNKISVQAIGQECGFSSKTSFYRAFKKVTQMTPMQFAEQKF